MESNYNNKDKVHPALIVLVLIVFLFMLIGFVLLIKGNERNNTGRPKLFKPKSGAQSGRR